MKFLFLKNIHGLWWNLQIAMLYVSWFSSNQKYEYSSIKNNKSVIRIVVKENAEKIFLPVPNWKQCCFWASLLYFYCWKTSHRFFCNVKSNCRLFSLHIFKLFFWILKQWLWSFYKFGKAFIQCTDDHFYESTVL